MSNGFVYPSLPAKFDFGFVRLGGAGLGNCLYVYFAAFVLARRLRLPLLAPVWSHWRVATMLRGGGDLRRYGSILKPAPDEWTGPTRLMALARLAGTHTTVRTGPTFALCDEGDGPIRVVIGDYTFDGLGAHRSEIRNRLHQIARLPTTNIAWGSGGYAAVHVRLGDFMPPSEARNQRDEDNRRIDLDWYVSAIAALRKYYPLLPIRLFSDGSDAELARLLSIPGIEAVRGGDALSDLLGLASASLLIGSNSTFSRWGAFLGDMPSVWRASPGNGERLTSIDTPLLIIDDAYDRIAETMAAMT